MKGAILFAACLALIGCTSAEDETSTPREADVARLEAKIAAHPCIGSLNDWERNYRYGMSKRVFWPDSDHPDLDVIEFHFRRAGTIVIAPSRNRMRTGANGDWPDSSAIQSIDGSFVISSGRLSVGKCAPVRAGSS